MTAANHPAMSWIERRNQLDRLARLAKEATAPHLNEHGVFVSWDKPDLDDRLAKIIELATTIRSYP